MKHVAGLTGTLDAICQAVAADGEDRLARSRVGAE